MRKLFCLILLLLTPAALFAQSVSGTAILSGTTATAGGAGTHTAPTVTGNVCTGRNFGGPTYSCTYTSPLSGGSTLALQLGYAGPLVSISGCGAKWTTTSINGNSSSTYGVGALAGPCTVTLTASAGYGELRGIEVSGSSGVDVVAAQTCLNAAGSPSATCGTNISGGTTMSAPAVTTTQGNDLVIGFYNNDGGNAPTFTPGTGYTSQGQSSDLFIETMVAVTARSNTPTATSTANSSSFNAGTIALKGT